MSDMSLANEKQDVAAEYVESYAVPSDRSPEHTLELGLENEAEGDFEFTIGKSLAMLSMVLGYLSDTLVVVMVGAILSQIDQAVGPSVNYTWMATSLTVGGAALAPVVGRFGDIFGRRNFLLAGNAIAFVGCLICATANSVNQVIAGGVLIGIASSMRQMAWASLGEVVPKKYRAFAFAMLQAVLAAASAFGPVIAFKFVQHFSFRPVFWLPFALDAAGFILVFFCYHPMNQYIHEEGKTVWQQVLKTDFVGTFLFVTGIVVFLLGISFGGTQFPWTSAGTIAPIVIGFALLVACGFYEAYVPLTYPIFPPKIFKNIRGFTVLQVATFVVGMLFYSVEVIWPTLVQSLFTTDINRVAWFVAAPGLGGFIFSLVWGYIAKLVGHTRYFLIVVSVLQALFCALNALVTPTAWLRSCIFVALTLGMNSAVSFLSVAMVQVGVPHEYLGVASGVIVTARSLGGAVATTIYVSILRNHLTSQIPTDVGGPLIENGVPLTEVGPVIEALTTGDTKSPALAAISPQALLAAIAGLKNAYVSSYRLIFLVSIAFGIISIIVVCFSADVEHLMTKKIDIKLAEGVHAKVQDDTGEGHVLRHTADGHDEITTLGKH